MLFVDEAWQLPHHLFDQVDERRADRGSASATSASCRRSRSARTRGAATPATTRTARGRPTTTTTARTWSAELPAVWRPAAGHLGAVARVLPGVGRAQLRRRTRRPPGRSSATCRASPRRSGRRSRPASRRCSRSTASPDAEAADVDLPLVEFVESLLDELFAAGFTLSQRDVRRRRLARPARSQR